MNNTTEERPAAERWGWSSLKTRITLLTLATFLVSIWSLTFFTERMLHDELQSTLSQQQFSNVSILAERVNRDLEERLWALETIAKEVTPTQLVDAASLQASLQNRLILRHNFNGGVWATRQDGIVIASVPPARIGTNFSDREYMVTVLKDGKSTISKPITGRVSKVPSFAIAVPIRSTQGKVIGALVGVNELDKPNFLDQITNTGYGKTGSYLLVAPQHKLTITGTDKSRIMQPVPAVGVNPLYDRYVNGFEGTGVVVDSRGLEVLSSAKQIPVADWLLIARMPSKEAFALIDLLHKRLLWAALSFTLLAGALTWWILKRQLAPIFTTLNALVSLTDTSHPLPVTREDEIGDLIGGFNGLLGVLNQRQEVLKESEFFLKESQRIAAIGSYKLDVISGNWKSSDALDEIFGIDKDHMRDFQVWQDLIHPQDAQMVGQYLSEEVLGKRKPFNKEYRIVRKSDGETRWVKGFGELEFGPEGNIVSMIGAIQDISERKQAEERIEQLAHFDQLTGLPNRATLDDHFKFALSLAQRSGKKLALLFLDIDHFKYINETLGHSIGDWLLVEVAKRLRQVIREEDTVSRQGGDEFIFVIPETDVPDAASLATKLVEQVSAPYQIDQHELTVTASIGIALYPNDGTNMETLSRNAESAMYRVKKEGRNGFRFFAQAMQTKAAKNMLLAGELRHALARHELQLHYQPQIAMKDGRVIGAEALLRWNHPKLGAISPATFIPIAEETGLIILIGEWVLKTATAQARRWLDIGLPSMVVSVNVSAVQFQHVNFFNMVSDSLKETGLSAQCLELELTEAVAMDNPQTAVAVMEMLHERDVRMSIDDFGTGYSSLSYLKRFKVYKLKIDQSFIRNLGSSPEDKAIVTAIISMASSLGLHTIAEGVETAEQLAFLRLHGCDEVQGYYFSKPVPADQFEAYVRESL